MCVGADTIVLRVGGEYPVRPFDAQGPITGEWRVSGRRVVLRMVLAVVTAVVAVLTALWAFGAFGQSTVRFPRASPTSVTLLMRAGECWVVVCGEAEGDDGSRRVGCSQAAVVSGVVATACEQIYARVGAWADVAVGNRKDGGSL